MIDPVRDRIVIRNAVVPGVGAGAAVVVEGRELAALVPAGRAVAPRPGDWDVDADGRLVVAGLIDAHTHLALGTLFRLAGLPGRPPPTVSDLRHGLRRRVEDRARPEDLEPLARAGALAALRAGVTTVFDSVRAAPGTAGEALDAVARGVGAVGLRARLSLAVRGAGAAAEVEAAAAFGAAHAAGARLRGCPGLEGISDVPDAALDALASVVPTLGLHACVGEDESDLAHAFPRFGQRPVEVLGARGLLGPRAVVAHAGTAVHAEGAALAESRSYLAVAPRAAMFWGAHVPPFVRFTSLGVQVVFGTDGVFPDVASEAVTAAMMQRHEEGSAGAAAALVGRIAWPAAARLATETFGVPTGSLAAGAAADLVVLDWRPPVPIPALPDGDLALLWAGAPASWVIVDGEVRLREGRLLGGNEAEIAARASEAAGRLLAS